MFKKKETIFENIPKMIIILFFIGLLCLSNQNTPLINGNIMEMTPLQLFFIIFMAIAINKEI